MQNLVDILSGPHLLSFGLLFVVVLLEKNIPWLDKYHPLSLWKLCTIRMAEKVLPSKDYGTKQQKLSGSLAYLILLLPVCLLISVFIYLSVYPIFFEALLLLIALRFNNIRIVGRKILNQLATEKKILARHTLQPIVLRETENMSALGLTKATCETLILRFNYQFCAVVFWFILTGGIGAILYRVLYECSQSWNIKLARFSYFGLSVKYIVSGLQYLPTILAGLSLAITSLTSNGFKALINKWAYLNIRLFMLNVAGASLNIQLAGPVIYEQQKIRTKKCGGSKQIILADIKRTQTLINLASYVWLVLSFLIYTLLYSASK
jgi:adenosylcobinamide-phosphate synthase